MLEHCFEIINCKKTKIFSQLFEKCVFSKGVFKFETAKKRSEIG